MTEYTNETRLKYEYYPYIEKAYKKHSGLRIIVGKRKEFLEELAINWGKEFEHKTRFRDDFTIKKSEVYKKAEKFIIGFFKMFEPAD